ncbi:MAG: HEAT repeat domain-containing protein, partial [Gammaproteobacteria bacterium]|nr:HEAT repeat domain-containing protein [Gammaproteobacteria bacterium]
MEYGENSEVILRIAENVSVSVVVLTVGVLLLVIFFRSLLILREKRKEKFLSQWRPILYETLFSVPDSLPKLKKGHIKDFIDEWNQVQFNVKGVCVKRLNYLARKLEINKYLRKKLKSRSVRDQLTAIISLGSLRDYESTDELIRITQQGKPIPSLAAARALLQIDPMRSIEFLLNPIVNREDWPLSLVAKILIEAKNEKLCSILAEATLVASPRQLPRLIQLLDAVNCKEATDVFRQLLAKEQDGRVITLCLQAIKNPAGLDMVRKYLDHDRWHVRVHAATALGRIGTDDDIAKLIV